MVELKQSKVMEGRTKIDKGIAEAIQGELIDVLVDLETGQACAWV